MSWKDLVCLGLIILGIVLFLYGANNFDASTGWAGVYLIIIGFVAKIILMIWGHLKKSDNASTG